MIAAVGVDAGGSTTRAVAVDAAGTVAAEARGGSANPLITGLERAVATIVDLARTVDPHGSAAALCAGVAGAGGSPAATALERALREALPQMKALWVVTDARAALRAGGDVRPAAVVIAGTGSIAYGETADGREVRAGGYGAIIGDDGAYAAGIAAIRHTALALDGVVSPDALSQRVAEALRVTSARELIAIVHVWPPDVAAIAALAPHVGDADEAGVASARAIVERLGADLGAAAGAVCAAVRSSAPLPVVMTGGAFDALPRLGGLVRAVIQRAGACMIEQRLLDGALGAAFIALGRSATAASESSMSKPQS